MNSDQLVGRRILLIVPSFFGYDKAIEKKLIEKGARVTLYGDRPSATVLAKAIIRVSPNVGAVVTRSYIDSIIGSHGAAEFDDILVVKGESFTPSLLSRLFTHFSSARKIFYAWDSFRNSRGSQEKLALFDHKYTFDSVDADNTPGLLFRPLFFGDEFKAACKSGSIESVDERTDLDLLFVGTAHTDRYRIIKKIDGSLNRGVRRMYYLYVPSEALYYGKRIFVPQYWGAQKREFQFRPLDKYTNALLFGKAKVILDIERSVQTGLTIRTLEALAASKKIVTTNPHIRGYDIFDEQNVCIIDRNRPYIPAEFFDAPYKHLPDNVVARYSLDSWLNDVFALPATNREKRMAERFGVRECAA